MNKEQQLHLAVKDNDVSTVESLLIAGVDINCLFYGWTPLQYAISLGNESLSLLLIEKGADIQKLHHKTDGCPFEGAIKKKLPKVIQALLEKGVDPNKVLSNGSPALFTALEKENKHIMKVLINEKANVNILNKNGESALFLASRDGLSDIVQILLEAGADMDIQSAETGFQTPLIVATANEHNKVVKLLLRKNCNTNLQDSDSWTALWHAYSNSDEDMMNLLLKSGAAKDIPDADGQTILQDATDNEDDSVIELITRFTRSWTN
ncbi:Y045-like protein [Mya arenaria]|uniref:Y045-like protein n=1 Tax=Mya arenaria TaxID=6604 RepID=A0ABY7DMF9_MYAAR|nr:ankyrin homolog [Mya arenaria]WAQ97907.1 Y045-like protein [Mya arenaria]